MAIKDAFIAELKFESASTRKMLEKVPLDKKDWKPHEKSMSVGRLATHIAETPHWCSDIVHIDHFDFAKHYNLNPRVASTTEELLEIFQSTLDKALDDLASQSDADFDKIWTVASGEHILSQLPKKVAIRDRLEEVGKNINRNRTYREDGKSLLHDYISVEELRACTTCQACVQECPVSISPHDIILQLRRYLVMEESNSPAEWTSMFSNVENNFAPWKFSPDERDKWTETTTP